MADREASRPTSLRSEAATVFVNPETGDSVIIHSAYSFSDAFVSGDPNPLNTHEWTFKGNAELIRASEAVRRPLS